MEPRDAARSGAALYGARRGVQRGLILGVECCRPERCADADALSLALAHIPDNDAVASNFAAKERRSGARHGRHHKTSSLFASSAVVDGSPVITVIVPSLFISTRATVRPQACTASTARRTSRFLNACGARDTGHHLKHGVRQGTVGRVEQRSKSFLWRFPHTRSCAHVLRVLRHCFFGLPDLVPVRL
jgi:hypothetical protein